jgi:hypothetical protein
VPVIFYAQTEAEMKVQADKLFDTEKYLEATPLYLRLIALQPRDVSYNYKYGTCLLYNSNNKQEAIRYLSFATNDPNIAPEAFYFLGKALHLNYQFNEAIKHYTTYLQKNPKGLKSAEAERGIQMCQNGKRLMTTISDIIVTDKKEITIDKFFRIYDLKDIGGNLLVTAEFQTKLDKKNNHTPLIHFPQNPSVIYYSSYGENGTNGKDIYVRRKLPDGTWGMPQPIPGNVNTPFDEDFPYMHPDGNYLYFSSKGHNSMGGFDVFRSKYDPETNSYGPPENMDFAISSPDDDMFYVVDSLNKEAYFASARQSQDGKLFVYRVKVDRVPIQLAVVKGNFVSEVDPKIKKINFEIKDYSNGESVGKFNSNDKAVYLITFPKGGKYEYIMTIEGSSQEFRSIVSIPFLKEFKPLKQKIIHTTEGGKEIVKILNLFDEDVEDPQAVIAEVIKMRSELNINVNEFDLNELEQDQKNKEVLSEIGLGDLNTNELGDILQKQVQRGNENKNLINNIGNNINNLVVENANEFVQLEEQIKSKVAEANSTTQTDAKYVALKEAERMINKQQELKQYSKSLVRLNDSIKGVLSTSSSGSDQQKMQELSKQFNQLYESGKEKEAIQLVVDNKDLLKDVMNDKSTDLIQNLVDKVVRLDDEMSKLKDKVDAYSKDLSNNEIEINTLQNSIYTAKKKDVPAIEQKIAEKQNEIVIIKEERDNLQRSIDKKSLEKYQVNQQIEILQDAISNKSVASVTKEQATKAIAETEKTNSNTLTAYVTQQINELEKKDPTLKDRIVVSSGLRAQNIYSDYKSSTKGIQDDPSLSKEDKIYKLLSNERNAIKQLDNRLEEIEKLRENDKTNEQLNNEKASLLTYKQEIEEQVAKHEKLVENLLSQNGSNDPEILVNALEPGYTDNKKAVESNPNLSEEEKLTALNAEDEKLVSSVDKELTSVKKQLAADPSNAKLKEKEANLTQIKSATESSIATRDKALEQKQLAITPKERIAQLNPSYEEKTNEILTSSTLSDDEKLTALNKEDQTLVASVDKEIASVKTQLAKDPSNKALLAKESALNQIKADKEAAIEQRKAELNAGNTVVSTVSTKEVIAQLNPSYEEKTNEILTSSTLSDDEKLTALNKEDETLVTSVDKEIGSVKTQIAKDPNNKALLAKESALNQIKADKEAAIEQRKAELNAGNTVAGTTSTKEVIAQLNPSYEEKTNEILTSSTLSDDEKLTALNKEDEALLANVKTELTSVQKQLKKDPENKALQEKETVLNQIKAEKEAAIEQRKAELNAGNTVASTVSTKEVIAQLNPSYEEKTNEILTSSTLSDDEKLNALNKEDETLLTSVDKELASVKTQLAKDPSNKAVQAKETALNQIKAEKEAAIEQRKAELNAGNTVASSQNEQLINSLDPTYTKDVEKIASNESLTENEKEAAYQKLDKELLTTIDERQTAIEKSLKKDPTNETLLQEKESLTELKTLVESRVEEREQLMASQTTIDLSDEVLTEKKVNLRAQLDPTYDKKIEEAQTSDKPEVEKLSAELKVEETLLTKLKTEETKLQKALAKDPSNAELKTQLTVAQQLRKDTENRISSLNESIDAVKNGTSIAAISEEEKATTIANALPTYASEKEQIASNGDLSKEEKVDAELALENDLVESIDEAITVKQTALKNDPSNVQLKRDLAVLNQVKKETEERIEELNSTGTEVEKNYSASSDEKNKEIESLRPEYAKEISDIQANSNLTELEKLEALQTEDQKLVAAVYDRIEQLEDALNEEPSNTNLQDEYRVLKVIEKELEAKIEARQKEINSGGVASISTSEKAKMLNSVDESYDKDVQDLENNVSSEEKKLKDLNERDVVLKGKLEKALVQAEKELEKDPTNKEKQQTVATLKVLITDAENRIEERENQLSGTTSTAQVSEAEKEAVQAELMPDYATSVKEIENNSSLSVEEKKDAILSVENELGERISTEKITLKEELASNPSNTQVKDRLAVVEALETDSEARIEEIKSSDASSQTTVSEAEKEKVISEVYPDYESKKETLAVSKLEETRKIDASLKLENELLTKLTAEEKTIEKALAKDPTSVELKEKLAAVKALIDDQKSTIETLENQKATRAVEAQKEATLAKVDPTYSTDIEKLTTSTSETKQADLVAREEAHQTKIETQIATNDKALAKKENPVLEAQNTALKEELSASKERVSGGITSPSNISIDLEEQESYQSNLREDVLQENASVVNAEPSELNEIKEQVVVLERYETALKERIAEKETVLKSNPSDEASQKEVLYLKDELTHVQKKLRKAKISIGELEKIAAFGTTEDQRYDDPELNQLNEKSASLQKELANENLSAKEKQSLQKELTQVETQKTVQENKLMTEEIADNKQQSTESESQLKDDAKINETAQTNSRVALAQQKELNKEAATLIEDANSTKNPVEKNYLLNKALEKQEQANDIVQATLVENKLQALEEEKGIESLETKADLEKKQRRYTILVGELTREIQTLDQQIASAKGKDLMNLQTEKNQKVEERSLVQKQLEEVNNVLAKEDKLPETISPLAMETAVSYNEEREIAATEGYKNYQEKANAALEIEKQITKLDAQILQEKNQTKQLASKVLEDPSDENKQSLEQNVTTIKQLEATRVQLKEELDSKQVEANAALPTNTEKAMKMQNLVKRGIEPIQRMAIVAALVPMPANGLTIKEADTYSTTNPIPVDVKTPTGLVYRVQIGAFAKPIPQNLFNKFNPVSGEKLNNGITRYMAGYFNNSKKVVEARDQIKQLGYNDAFAVAYCDGKRITLAEARILEANGQCVAKGENELVLEVATNTAEKMGLGDTTKLVKVDPLTYNKAPGAVKAEPIEKHLGLFFTVQVGAFNRPVAANTLNGIEPLNTLRLVNGQIRYTTGMFNTVEEARPKKQDAIDRGIKDAFITAYYKGERIPIADALKLLEDQGNGVLELNQLKATPVVETPKEVVGVTPAVTTEEVIEETTVVEFNRYQIVTKKTFDEFPREVLNRYNAHGSFYYDETDKTVKSTVASSKDELPDVYAFRNDVDTLITLDEGDEPGVTVIATFASTSLPGDFTDWLLRYNFRREMKQTEDTIELRISRVSDEKLPELENKLNEFAIPFREERIQE